MLLVYSTQSLSPGLYVLSFFWDLGPFGSCPFISVPGCFVASFEVLLRGVLHHKFLQVSDVTEL